MVKERTGGSLKKFITGSDKIQCTCGHNVFNKNVIEHILLFSNRTKQILLLK